VEALFGLLFYVPALVLAVRAADPLPHRREVSRQQPPWATIGLLLLVGIPSLAQLAVPEIYTWLHRDSDLIMNHGQWWRPYTSFVVQDGGLAGTAFNLTTLAVVGSAAERVWGRALTLGIFFGCLLLFSIDTFRQLRRDVPPGDQHGRARARRLPHAPLPAAGRRDHRDRRRAAGARGHAR
jgi:hypothetical protein